MLTQLRRPGLWHAHAQATILFVLVSCAGVACKGPSAESSVDDASPSPQAKAEPAPLATPPSAAAAAAPTATSTDGGVALGPLRADRALAPDAPREVVRETPGKDAPRELAGYALQATVRTGEGPPTPKTPEVNTAAIDTARRRTEMHVAIELSQTRARLVLSGGFVLPQGTEFRSRWDAYGHVLLWPGEDTYRVVPPGALRALLGERRLDVAPVSHATTVSTGEGPHKLGLSTRRVEITTRAAKATLELATLRDAGGGGPLLCRFLLDLMSAPPSTNACAGDEIPLRAELRWTTRGTLTFEVTSVTRRADFAPQELAAPPSAATFSAAPLPSAPSEVLVPKSELAALRTGPSDVPSPAQAQSDAQAPPPESGLLLVNTTDELRVGWIDGFAAAWVAPGGRALLSSLPRGRYVVQWRTFLGDSWEPAAAVFAPGVTDASGPRSSL
jgi:hypothetical protein